MAIARTIVTKKIPAKKTKNGKVRRPSKVQRAAFRRGRVAGWRDVLNAYLRQDAESFQDWLYTLTGHDEY